MAVAWKIQRDGEWQEWSPPKVKAVPPPAITEVASVPRPRGSNTPPAIIDEYGSGGRSEHVCCRNCRRTWLYHNNMDCFSPDGVCLGTEFQPENVPLQGMEAWMPANAMWGIDRSSPPPSLNSIYTQRYSTPEARPTARPTRLQLEANLRAAREDMCGRWGRGRSHDVPERVLDDDLQSARQASTHHHAECIQCQSALNWDTARTALADYEREHSRPDIDAVEARVASWANLVRPTVVATISPTTRATFSLDAGGVLPSVTPDRRR